MDDSRCGSNVEPTKAGGTGGTIYLGDPQQHTESLTGFRQRGIEQFLREELFSG